MVRGRGNQPEGLDRRSTASSQPQAGAEGMPILCPGQSQLHALTNYRLVNDVP